MKKRADFVRMNTSAARFVVSCFILQMEAATNNQTPVQVGYTVTKKIGNAVVRNRVKRRLREAFRQVLHKTKPGHHYVFIARHKALSCDFSELVREMEFAISRVRAK